MRQRTRKHIVIDHFVFYQFSWTFCCSKTNIVNWQKKQTNGSLGKKTKIYTRECRNVQIYYFLQNHENWYVRVLLYCRCSSYVHNCLYKERNIYQIHPDVQHGSCILAVREVLSRQFLFFHKQYSSRVGTSPIDINCLK